MTVEVIEEKNNFRRTNFWNSLACAIPGESTVQKNHNENNKAQKILL